MAALPAAGRTPVRVEVTGVSAAVRIISRSDHHRGEVMGTGPTPAVPTSVDPAAPVLVRHEIDVRAPLETVWRLHADVTGWPAWNPDITSAVPTDPEAPFTPGARFTWTSFGFTVTSTVHDVTAPARVLWGGTADGISGVHEWRLTRTAGGVRVVTEESFAGDPVEADPAAMRQALDVSLTSWLSHLKRAAESAAG
ncbi:MULTISPECIES: SRPBCC family protein [unclassified Streptomyces]|uniref:SRPBCC family protein n=1 Tax=unclassified Streptomyces TaxID=2593676 RepID=UPI002E2BF7BE|nr:SRPBCC family protein [Streptomyces sp. NBC_00223]